MTRNDSFRNQLALDAEPWVAKRVAEVAAQIGVPWSGKVNLRYYRGFWGFCWKKIERIDLNACLLFTAPEILDFVICHETCHLVHMNHGEGFKELLTTVCPDWPELERMVDAKDYRRFLADVRSPVFGKS